MNGADRETTGPSSTVPSNRHSDHPRDLENNGWRTDSIERFGPRGRKVSVRKYRSKETIGFLRGEFGTPTGRDRSVVAGIPGGGGGLWAEGIIRLGPGDHTARPGTAQTKEGKGRRTADGVGDVGRA